MVRYDSVTGITGNLLLPMSDAPLFVCDRDADPGAIVRVAYRRDPVFLGTSVGGVIMATLLFTTSTRNYDGYWFLTLTTALTLTYGMAIAAIPSKTAVKWIGIALLLVVAWRQPARIADSTAVLQVSAVRHHGAGIAPVDSCRRRCCATSA